MYIFRLYIVARSPRSVKAIADLKSILDDGFRGRYSLEVIYVLENPQLAEDEHILATPTLIKELPPPLRRIIGDLSDPQKVIMGLDLES